MECDNLNWSPSPVTGEVTNKKRLLSDSSSSSNSQSQSVGGISNKSPKKIKRSRRRRRQSGIGLPGTPAMYPEQITLIGNNLDTSQTSANTLTNTELSTFQNRSLISLPDSSPLPTNISDGITPANSTTNEKLIFQYSSYNYYQYLNLYTNNNKNNYYSITNFNVM